ncbi:hypothetical protein KSS87_023133 [Heliosperma pusillum]|nr:hypothetical protein KSS87_023133 [Heliosperma pusillum]
MYKSRGVNGITVLKLIEPRTGTNGFSAIQPPGLHDFRASGVIMVYFKELCNKDLTYLAIVDRETDDGNSGTRFVTRQSLRSSKGEASVVDYRCFHAEMSLKFDLAKPDLSARYLLKCNLKTKIEQQPSFPLLRRRIIAGSVKWGSNNLKIYGESKHIPGYWEWTEDVLARFDDALEASSISSAINASLYSYDKNVHIMRAFFEGWCSTTNTLHTREGELSISLWDLKMLGGLSIVGEIYDETVPHPGMLKERNTRDDSTVPPTCKYLFVAYHRLVRRSTTPNIVTAKQWIEFWFKRGATYQPPVKKSRTKLRPKSTQNPSGEFEPRPSNEWCEEEQVIFEKLGLTNNAHKEKLYLAAYISGWLCTFVLPENEDRKIRAGTFETACLMAEGRRFCLAAPVLASIYRGLNDLVTSLNPGYSKSNFPAHYLYGWLAYYFNTHHDVRQPPRGPSMVKYSGAVRALAIKDDDARKRIHDGKLAKAHCFIPHKVKADIMFDNGDLDDKKFSYLASLRSTYLVLRNNDFFHIEPYNPQRFSRQFGFCQDIPETLYRGSDKTTASCHEVLRYWQILLFSGSMSRVFLPSAPITWNDHVTTGFSKWWKARDVSDLRKNVEILVNSSKLKKGQTHHDAGGSAPARPLGVHPRDNDHRRSNRGETYHNSDGNSEIDPKHERRGDIALELGALIPEQDVMKRSLRVKLGKGKELAMLNHITSIDKSAKTSSQESKTGSSFADVSQGSIDMQVTIKIITPRIIERTQKNLGAIANVQPCNVPAGSTVSFWPPNLYTDVFYQARQEIGSRFLAKLKSASYHDVAGVAVCASETYRSIQHLKGDVTLLQEQVDSYVSAVNAYLVVERVASGCQRSESLEKDMAIHQKEVDNAKSLLDKAIKEYQVQVAEHSTIKSKIKNLETELSKARDLESTLSKSIEAKGNSMTVLESHLGMQSSL